MTLRVWLGCQGVHERHIPHVSDTADWGMVSQHLGLTGSCSYGPTNFIISLSNNHETRENELKVEWAATKGQVIIKLVVTESPNRALYPNRRVLKAITLCSSGPQFLSASKPYPFFLIQHTCSQGHHFVFQWSPVSQPSLRVPVVPSHHFVFQWSPVPHPHSPMNMDTPICPLPPNSSSMVNAPQLVTPVRSSPRHHQVTSVTLSPQVFEGESDTGIFTDGSKDASSPTKKRTQRRKPREEFTTNDLKALLSAVLNVNPWMCACGESKDKWEEVSVLVKQANACEGRSADTLKNKVYSLLKAIET
ncbi:hypothetical protein BU17DRAFT_66027 [Hysterangium stoloniferum]|nr:hypothetical protein BU17DRAFT_66027 [Hysterangium stoloniferum]